MLHGIEQVRQPLLIQTKIELVTLTLDEDSTGETQAGVAQ